METAGAYVWFYALIVVMVIVPLMLQPPSSERGKRLAGRNLADPCGHATAALRPSGAVLTRERRLWFWAVAVVLVLPHAAANIMTAPATAIKAPIFLMPMVTLSWAGCPPLIIITNDIDGEHADFVPSQ